MNIYFCLSLAIIQFSGCSAIEDKQFTLTDAYNSLQLFTVVNCESSFAVLLSEDKSFTVYHRNNQKLAIEM